MDSFIHADIFFFVTTIIAVVLGILLAVVLVYVVKIAKNVSATSETIRKESVLLADDVDHLRSKVRGINFNLSGIFSFIRAFITKSSKKHEK